MEPTNKTYRVRNRTPKKSFWRAGKKWGDQWVMDSGLTPEQVEAIRTEPMLEIQEMDAHGKPIDEPVKPMQSAGPSGVTKKEGTFEHASTEGGPVTNEDEGARRRHPRGTQFEK